MMTEIFETSRLNTQLECEELQLKFRSTLPDKIGCEITQIDPLKFNAIATNNMLEKRIEETAYGVELEMLR